MSESMRCDKCGKDLFYGDDGNLYCPRSGEQLISAPEKNLYCEKCGKDTFHASELFWRDGAWWHKGCYATYKGRGYLIRKTILIGNEDSWEVSEDEA